MAWQAPDYSKSQVLAARNQSAWASIDDNSITHPNLSMPPLPTLSERGIVEFMEEPNLTDDGLLTFLQHTQTVLETGLYSVEANEDVKQTMKLLVGQSTNLEAKLPASRTTALHLAVQKNWEAPVRQLLQKGANVNVRAEDGMMPLHSAAANGNDRIVQLLIDNGANVGARGPNRDAAIHMALGRGNTRIFEVLLEQGLKARVKTYSLDDVLEVAVSKNQVQAVRQLVKKGAHVEAITKDGTSMLHLAAELGHNDVIEALLDNGADINARTGKKEHTALFAAIYTLKVAAPFSTVRLLVEKGANLEAGDRDGTTPLEMALRHRNREILVELLVTHGVAFKGMWDWRDAIIAAIEADAEPIVQVLLSQGEDLEKRTEGMDMTDLLKTPLVMAIKSRRLAMAELLAMKGVIFKRGQVGSLDYRPIVLAASKHGYEALLRVLIKGGVEFDLEEVDDDGLTALELALNAGHAGVLELLLEELPKKPVSKT